MKAAEPATDIPAAELSTLALTAPLFITAVSLALANCSILKVDRSRGEALFPRSATAENTTFRSGKTAGEPREG